MVAALQMLIKPRYFRTLKYFVTVLPKGYAVASIDYRLDTSISNRAVINAMYDARAAIRFFKAYASTYKIDTAKVFMGGESAGAMSSFKRKLY